MKRLIITLCPTIEPKKPISLFVRFWASELFVAENRKIDSTVSCFLLEFSLGHFALDFFRLVDSAIPELTAMVRQRVIISRFMPVSIAGIWGVIEVNWSLHWSDGGLHRDIQ